MNKRISERAIEFHKRRNIRREDLDTIHAVLAKFREYRLSADIGTLPEDIRNALPHLKIAMDGINTIYRLQQNENLPEIWRSVMEGDDEDRKKYFSLFNGPYNPLLDFKSDYPEYEKRAPGCMFYPAGMTAAGLRNGISVL